MGAMFAMGACIGCKKVFTFNPDLVPSTSALTGTREPICEECFDAINRFRKSKGQEPFVAAPGAYEPAEC